MSLLRFVQGFLDSHSSRFLSETLGVPLTCRCITLTASAMSWPFSPYAPVFPSIFLWECPSRLTNKTYFSMIPSWLIIPSIMLIPNTAHGFPGMNNTLGGHYSTGSIFFDNSLKYKSCLRSMYCFKITSLGILSYKATATLRNMSDKSFTFLFCLFKG